LIDKYPYNYKNQGIIIILYEYPLFALFQKTDFILYLLKNPVVQISSFQRFRYFTPYSVFLFYSYNNNRSSEKKECALRTFWFVRKWILSKYQSFQKKRMWHIHFLYVYISHSTKISENCTLCLNLKVQIFIPGYQISSRINILSHSYIHFKVRFLFYYT